MALFMQVYQSKPNAHVTRLRRLQLHPVVDTILCGDLAGSHRLQSNFDKPSAYGDILVSVLIFYFNDS